MLQYVLRESKKLTGRDDALFAQVVRGRTVSQDEIIDRVMGIGAGLTRSDVISVLEAWKQVLANIVADGGSFSTDLFSARPSIKGVYNSLHDSFDPARHQLCINTLCGPALRDAIARAQPSKLTATTPTGPVIVSVTDLKTGSTNSLLTPNHNLRIDGSRMKIMGSHPDVGVRFIDDAGNSIKVSADELIVNNRLKLILLIPGLPAGTYRLQLTTQHSGGGRCTQTPHSITFDKPLAVR